MTPKYTIIETNTLLPLLVEKINGRNILSYTPSKTNKLFLTEDRFLVEKIRYNLDYNYRFSNREEQDLDSNIIIYDTEKNDILYVLENFYDRIDFHDYESKPIGGENPYYCCSHCGISDPQINGYLHNHSTSCEYREEKEEELLAEEKKILNI